MSAAKTFYDVLQSTRLTAAERDRLHSAYYAEILTERRESLARGEAIGKAKAEQPAKDAELALKHEVLDAVCRALGLDDD